MTKSIRSYPEQKQRSVIERRLNMRRGGAGYHSAVSAARKLGMEIPESSNWKERLHIPASTVEELADPKQQQLAGPKQQAPQKPKRPYVKRPGGLKLGDAWPKR